MLFKTLALVALIGTAAENGLRGEEIANEVPGVEHLDLEIVNANGDRELFPLIPGTKCPTGYKCHTRTNTLASGMTPMGAALKKNMKTPVQMTMNWEEFNSEIRTTVSSNKFCDRRAAMARAAGMAAGVAAATVAQPAYAAETKEVKMGSDAGLLAFVPAKTQICSGDSVKWLNNKGGPHNVVFDEDAIPAGVDSEKISCPEQMGEEDDSFTMSFSTKGEYNYYCEPHRGAGMQGLLTVA